jgi:coproporphyrinogen III oxidase
MLNSPLSSEFEAPMNIVPAQSKTATNAYSMVLELQSQFVSELEKVCGTPGGTSSFQEVPWYRDLGAHGGGRRMFATNNDIFNRASINTSQVHYDDAPAKPLGSASALSAIVHPKSPLAPSVHIHISWTELKTGRGYWRIMADLNPSTESQEAKTTFDQCLQKAAPNHFEKAKAQGDRYFFIPVLNRHRGVSHFYLEDFNTNDAVADFSFARSFGKAVITCYANIIQGILSNRSQVSKELSDQQLAYHTLYLFQVLTLDRGTTSGLLVHNENDLGILGSLPAYINRSLLEDWKKKMPEPQDQLVENILVVLPKMTPCPIGDEEKHKLALAVRKHYLTHPKALDLQARGDVLPPTVNNHMPSKPMI